MSGPTGVVARRILTALLVASAVVHAVVAVRGWPSPSAVLGAVLAAAVLVAALLVVASLVPMARRQADLLAAIVVGALGVASFLVPAVVALAGGESATAVLDAWSVGGFLLDTVVVRTAGLTLRREAGAGSPRGGR